jgi:cytochrome c-type biogenesis protein CcsB
LEININEQLSQYSLLVIYASMALLAVSFLLSTLHLANISSQAAESEKAEGNVLVKTKTQQGSAMKNSGLWVLGAATVVLGIGVTMRGIAAQRVPWANMYEFAISSTLVIMMIYLMSLYLKEVHFIAPLVSGFSLLSLGVATSLFYVQVSSLMPALQSFWLVLHVIVAVLATSFFYIAAALHITYLVRKASWSQGGSNGFQRVISHFPSAETLDRFAYRFIIVGFVLWSFTLIAGAIWAERAWNRYWGWDTKEVWTFIIWVVYAGYLHAKATRGWTGKRAAYLGLVGFAAVLFNFTIVNLFFEGLHVYSGL